MNRLLQHAALALNKEQNNGEQKIDLLFIPYIIAIAILLVFVKVSFQFLGSWICEKYFGRVESPEPMTGEELLAQLSEEQRDAVRHAVIAQVCKVSSLQRAFLDKSKNILRNKACERFTVQAATTREYNSADTANINATEKDAAVLVEHEGDDQKQVSESDEVELIFPEPAPASRRRATIKTSIPTTTVKEKVEKCNTEGTEEKGPTVIELSTDTRTVDIEEGKSPPVEGNIDIALCASSCKNESIGAPPAQNDEGIPDNTCPICLGDYEKGSMLFTSKHCTHIFHVSCIMEWLGKNRNDCPVCRVELVTKAEMIKAAMALIHTTVPTVESR